MLSKRHERVKKMRYYVVKYCVMVRGLVELSFGVMMLDKDGNREFFSGLSGEFMEMELLVHELNGYKVSAEEAREMLRNYKPKKSYKRLT